MIIGFDGSRAFVSAKTGTENYSYQLLKALAKIDHKNQYIIYTRPATPGQVLQGYGNNFQFKELRWPRLWTQGGLSLQTFKDPLDVLFVPAHTLPIIRKPGLKTVVTVHDLGSEYLPAAHQLKQRIYLSYMQRRQLKGATKIIAVSQATKNDLVRRVGCDPKKIEVIYEGYDREKFKVKSSKLKVDIEVNRLKPYYLFVGTIQPRKNLERLIKAFARVVARHRTKNSPHFLIAGDLATPKLIIAGSKGWMSDQIYKLPKKLGIEKMVKFLGYVPDQDLPALYSEAIALVFPSLFEGFGLPILEAQACGCPVITSDISSMPEVAGPTSPRLRGVKKGAIFVDPYDVEDITNAMIQVMDKNVRSELIKNGFENIKRFSWEKCARETLAVLQQSVVSSPRRRGSN